MHRPPFLAARAVGPHEGLLKEAVHKFKYGAQCRLARPLARLMAGVAGEEKLYAGADLLLPVPLSQSRIEQRRFNQAELLARELAGITGVTMKADLLLKIIDTPPQAGLSRRERVKNLAAAFVVKSGYILRGCKVIVVDDVFTTGSTLAAVADVLKKAGVSTILGLTVTTGVLEEGFSSDFGRNF